MAPRIAARLAWASDGRRLATWHTASEAVLIQDLQSGRVDSVPLPSRDRHPGEGQAFLDGGDWSPRGDLLALAAGWSGGPSHILLLDLARGVEELLLTDSLQLRSPRWSSRGDALFFLRDGYIREGELWSIDVDGSPMGPRGPGRRITDLPGATRWTNSLGSPRSPSFDLSQDGRKLAYTTAYAHTNLSIIRSEEDGSSRPVDLTAGTAQKRCPRLSPDGSSVAFLQETPEGWDLFRVSVEGGSPVRLTFSGAVVSDCPSWGPESRRLAFGMAVGGTNKLAVVPALGGAPRVYEDSRMSTELAWAPGSRIAYQTPGNRTFRILDPDTGLEAPLTEDMANRGWMFDPRFSPDGSRLAVYWNTPGAQGVWAIAWADGTRTQVSRIRDFPIGWSRDGSSLYTVDPGGTVRRYPVEGGEATVIPQPPHAGDALCQPHERAAGLFWVCKAERSFVDVWMMEDVIGPGP